MSTDVQALLKRVESLERKLALVESETANPKCDDDIIMRVEDVAEYTGYSKSTIYKKTSSGVLKKMNNPNVGFSYYRLSDVKKMMAGEDAYVNDELKRFKDKNRKG